MKTSIFGAVLAAAFFAVSGASAATVTLSQKQDHLITLHDVDRAALSFAAPTTGGYANFGGYLKWSTREDGRRQDDGAWGTCLECGYTAGAWHVAYNPWNEKSASREDIVVDFGEMRDTVFLWIKTTHGAGSMDLAASDPVTFPVLSPVDDGSVSPDRTETGLLLPGSLSGSVASDAAALTAVPLPAGMWLLLSSLGAIAFLRRPKTA